MDAYPPRATDSLETLGQAAKASNCSHIDTDHTTLKRHWVSTKRRFCLDRTCLDSSFQGMSGLVKRAHEMRTRSEVSAQVLHNRLSAGADLEFFVNVAQVTAHGEHTDM